MQIEETRHPPGPSAGPSTSISRRFSTGTLRSAPRAVSSTESRRSDETAPISDSAFQTPDPGVSALSLPPLSPTSPDNREYDDSQQPAHLRDSGIDTSTSTNRRSSNRLSQSMPNLPPLMPATEDRPDLWRNDAEPPTFRPRTQGDDPNATQGLASNGGPVRANAVNDTQNRPQPRAHGLRRLLAFLGYGGTGNMYRKDLVGLIWCLGFGFVQVAVALALIIYASVRRSPRQPLVSEWTACDKPLGVWACLWIFKVLLDCGTTYWGFRRDWKGGQLRTVDVEEGGTSLPGPDARPPGDANPVSLGQGNDERQRRPSRSNSRENRSYHRLNFLLSLVIISWFLTANILVFTSLRTCRLDAPHLWWLNFSFLCLQYATLLEVFATALIVFIIGPLIFLIWSIVLICLGRHPLQNPHYISPEIGKVSKKVVGQIPLVLYIPTPPGEDEKKDSADLSDPAAASKPQITPKPVTAHTYPPKQSLRRSRFAFLRRKSSKPALGSGGAEKSGSGEKVPGTWEDCWEGGGLPFVRLDANRASCAICLLDFEEPKRRVAREVIRSWARKNKKSSEKKKREKMDKQVQTPSVADAEANTDTAEQAGPSSPSPSSSNQTQASPSHQSTSRRSSSDTHSLVLDNGDTSNDHSVDEDRSIRLEDAGEGAQPLRLLPCGHVFHKSCIDPWLTGVSGRCPTCQRPILPDPPRKNRRQNQERGQDGNPDRNRDQMGVDLFPP